MPITSRRSAPLRAALGLAGALCLTAAPTLAGSAGDLVFADRGPWRLDPAPRWSLVHEGPAAPGFLVVHDGALSLLATTDPSDGKPMMQLVEKTDTAERPVGRLPLSVPDPVVMFFLESVTRDISGLSGGSPFYVRNRIKDAVFRGPEGDVTEENGHKVVTLHPFADDPNKARLAGFDTLTIRFVLDPDPKKPVREMSAETAGPVAPHPPPGEPPVAPAPYRNRLVMQ